MSKPKVHPTDEMAQQDRLLDHCYDGIQEYDNPLPGWWKWIFAISIAFSVPYFIYYELGKGATIHQNHKAAVAEMKKLQVIANAKRAASWDRQALLKVRADEKAMAASAKVFASKCAVCHAADGGGGIGPNLTDDYWIHGNSLKAMYNIVRLGNLKKGMPAWGKALTYEELVGIVAYVSRFPGTKPKTSKKPEGKKMPRLKL